MGQRLSLHQNLKSLLGNDSLTWDEAKIPWKYLDIPWEGYDRTNVYFQPPATVKLKYPCIVYRRSDIDTAFADDNPYITNKRYQVTVIDANPDSLIPDKVGKLPKCVFDRHFTADNLNHDVYQLYY